MHADAPPTPSLGDLIVEQTTDAVIYADHEGIIVRWNPAAARLFGYPREEAVGQSLDLIIPEPLRAAHWRGFDAAMASGGTRLHGKPTVTRAVHRSGQKLYVEMSFSLIADTTGETIGSVAIARDVTARILAEKAAATARTGSD